jgi:hypothetical protein
MDGFLKGQVKTDFDGWLHDWPGSSQINMFGYLIGQDTTDFDGWLPDWPG